MLSFLRTDPVKGHSTVYTLSQSLTVSEASPFPTRSMVHEYGGLCFKPISDSLGRAFQQELAVEEEEGGNNIGSNYYIGSVFDPEGGDKKLTCRLYVQGTTPSSSSMIIAVGKYGSYFEGPYLGEPGVYAVKEHVKEGGEVVNEIVHIGRKEGGGWKEITVAEVSVSRINGRILHILRTLHILHILHIRKAKDCILTPSPLTLPTPLPSDV